MQTSGSKIMVLVLGLLASLFVLEVSLRIVGIVYFQRVQDDKAVKRELGAVAILCLGDSFTEGFGAPQGRGYPGQLAELFQKKYPEAKVKVINKGVSAYNTAMILQRFDKEVDEINPDILVILAGGANRWNAYGYGDYLNRNGLGNRLGNWLYEIKIFKLIKLFQFDLRSKKSRLLESYTLPVEMKLPPDAEKWRREGRACEREGKYGEAVVWYKKIIEKYPLAISGYNDLRTTYLAMGDMEGERQMLRKLIELDPKSLKYFVGYVPKFLSDPIKDQEDLQFVQRYAHVNPIAGDFLKKVTQPEKYHQEMKAWVNHDTEAMVRHAQKRGIKVILQTYPYYDNGERYENLSFINETLRGTAKNNAVLFVDHERLFDQLFLKGENRDDYFEPAKVHCNEKGYGVMAENIYCGIVAYNGLGVLPDAGPAEKKRCFELLNMGSSAPKRSL